MHTEPFKDAALEVATKLRDAGHQALYAGGCVRDRLMGRQAKDIDIATSALPDQVEALFPKTVAIGKAFGVIQVLHRGHPFEVATFRTDRDYTDGRRPDSIVFSTAEEDAKRRDFTVNGLFYDPFADRVIDYVGGVEDIRRRVIRAIGDPHARFAEDYLRMLRAVRFASVLEFAIDPETENAIRAHAPRITDIAAERVQQELTRLLTEAPRAGNGLRLLQRTGLLPVILPEITEMIGCEQPPEYHPEGDVFTHTGIMLDSLKHPTPVLAYATLLHDVGKPPTFEKIEQPDGTAKIRFHGHADVGARMTEAILERLRMPRQTIDDVTHCVRNHMRFGEVSRMKESTLRRLVGAPTFETELELHRVDCESSHGLTTNIEFLHTFVERLRSEPALPQPWVGGKDILALGVPSGPAVGRWLRLAYDAQLEGRQPDRDAMLAWLAQEIRNGRAASS